MNTFATAGYRIGHTMVADEIALRDNNCDTVEPGAFDLIEAFWNPQLVVDLGLEPFLKGFSTHKQYETDTKNELMYCVISCSEVRMIQYVLELISEV